MAIYTTLFVASDAELSRLFPGWRLPRTTPVRVKRRNPATGRLVTVEEWDPGRKTKAAPPRTLSKGHGRKVLPPVLPPENEYQSWLEEAAPILLRTFPHSAMKGVTGFELDCLAKSLSVKREPPARFVDCRDGEGVIDALPAGALQPLADLTDRQLRNAAKGWHRVLEAEGDWSDLEWALRRIHALAGEAVAREGQLFCHVLV